MTPGSGSASAGPISARGVAWLLFFALIFWAWWWLYSMAIGMGMTITGGHAMGEMSRQMSAGTDAAGMSGMSGMGGMSDAESMTGAETTDAMTGRDTMGALSSANEMGGMEGMGPMVGMTSLSVLIPMWVIMMAAMMGPTFVPTARTYEDLIGTGAGTRAGFVGLVAGYLAVWFGFGASIGLAHAALVDRGLVTGMGQSASVLLSVGILVAAGLYQFTSAKDRCLAFCRTPMVHFLANWRPGPMGGARMGARVGGWCVACCWGIMLIGFVGGTMNIIWMGIATALMTLEKLPQIGERLTRPLGVLFLGAAGLTAAGLI